MGLLFYGGVMEPAWIIGIAAYVAAEKIIPAGSRVSRLAGMALIVWGTFELYRALN
jgi:predicted metal-binding membrane protein